MIQFVRNINEKEGKIVINHFFLKGSEKKQQNLDVYLQNHHKTKIIFDEFGKKFVQKF